MISSKPKRGGGETGDGSADSRGQCARPGSYNQDSAGSSNNCITTENGKQTPDVLRTRHPKGSSGIPSPSPNHFQQLMQQWKYPPIAWFARWRGLQCIRQSCNLNHDLVHPSIPQPAPKTTSIAAPRASGPGNQPPAAQRTAAPSTQHSAAAVAPTPVVPLTGPCDPPPTGRAL